VVVPEAVEIDWAEPLPLRDRPGGTDVDIALDCMAVMERDLKAVEIDDV
jgi:hypothetical protein